MLAEILFTLPCLVSLQIVSRLISWRVSRSMVCHLFICPFPLPLPFAEPVPLVSIAAFSLNFAYQSSSLMKSLRIIPHFTPFFSLGSANQMSLKVVFTLPTSVTCGLLLICSHPHISMANQPSFLLTAITFLWIVHKLALCKKPAM